MKFGSSFVVAAIMATQAMVTAQPIAFSLPGLIFHPTELKTTTTKLVTFDVFHKKIILLIGGHSFIEDIYNSVVKTIIIKKTRVVPAHVSVEPLRMTPTHVSMDHLRMAPAHVSIEPLGMGHLSMQRPYRVGYKREDLEGRSYWDADEDGLERRGWDDESTELQAREFGKRRLDAREFNDYDEMD